MAAGKPTEALLSRYPFIAEIDESRIIGGAGHLYCIVPVDEKAEVVINRVQWDQSRGINEVTEALYRSETGEPVLLFANLDGVAYETDTQVLITDSSGNTCEWEPSLDAMSYLVPCVSENGDALSFDFTEYAWLNAPQRTCAVACRRLERHDGARPGRVWTQRQGMVCKHNGRRDKPKGEFLSEVLSEWHGRSALVI